MARPIPHMSLYLGEKRFDCEYEESLFLYESDKFGKTLHINPDEPAELTVEITPTSQSEDPNGIWGEENLQKALFKTKIEGQGPVKAVPVVGQNENAPKPAKHGAFYLACKLHTQPSSEQLAVKVSIPHPDIEDYEPSATIFMDSL